jgi:hypothetical protein
MENHDDLSFLESQVEMASTLLIGILDKKLKKAHERFPTATALHDQHCKQEEEGRSQVECYV